MKTRALVFLMMLLALSVATPVTIYQHGKTRLGQLQSGIAEQERRWNERLPSAERVAPETDSRSKLSPAEVSELARLRNESHQLRELLSQRHRLEREKRRIERARQNLGQTEPENPTALLVDELPRRQARVAALREWLEENPEQKIPELQFLSENSWVRSADRERVTDEDFESRMSAQRGNAEARFARMVQEALKAYAQGHNGEFPSDLQLLKPFFSTPIEDSILSRYQIVATKTLPKFLAEVGGEWAITQKAPINPKHDSRLAVGLLDRRGTLAEGRWDSAGEEP